MWSEVPGRVKIQFHFQNIKLEGDIFLSFQRLWRTQSKGQATIVASPAVLGAESATHFTLNTSAECIS